MDHFAKFLQSSVSNAFIIPNTRANVIAGLDAFSKALNLKFMRVRFSWCSYLSVLFYLTRSSCAAALPTVNSPKEPVTNKYDSVLVVDNYQWLENAAAPEVRDWMRLENERTHSYLTLLPYRDAIAQRLMQIRSEESARFGGLTERKGQIFTLRFKPPA